MVAYPSSSALPSTGALSLLWFHLFSQLPSVVAFHSPALSVLLPPPVMHCFLVPQAVSAPPTPAHSLLVTNLWSRGLGVQHPPHVSVFGDCANSSGDLFGSHSAFQISDPLLNSVDLSIN